MGRRRVEIKKIEDKSRLHTTFSKRQQGLFRKASQYATMCGGEVAFFTFTKAGSVFAFGDPNIDTIINRYLSMTGSSSDANDSEDKKNAVGVAELVEPNEKIGNSELCELENITSSIEEIKNKLVVALVNDPSTAIDLDLHI